MAGSRKALLKKISPFKGTGRYLQYLRCPCCGKLARGQAIGNSGSHQLSVSQCIRKLPGYRTGWEWGHGEPDHDMLLALEESLERALSQVRAKLGEGERVILAKVGLLAELAWEQLLPEVFDYGNGQDQGTKEEVIYPLVQTYGL